MSLRAIVRALGGDLYAGGRRANVPAPGHSPRDRSVSLLWTGTRLVAHGFGAVDWRAVLDDLRARGLIDAAGRPSDVGAAAPPPPPLRTPQQRVAAAAALWAGGRPLEGTLAERRLRLRGVRRPLSASLRYHPAVYAAVYAAAGPVWPALLAAIADPAGALAAVEITYLDPNGQRARRPRTSRKTVGARPAGSPGRTKPRAKKIQQNQRSMSARPPLL